MDVSEILERIRRESVERIRQEWRAPDGTASPPVGRELAESRHVVRFDRTGWLQELDVQRLLAALPAGTGMRVDTFAGRYAIEGTPLCTIAPAPPDDGLPELEAEIRDCVALGPTRTMQQDVAYGLRQLADVALKALSPGINDPTTAQDAIFHSAAVLVELLGRDPPPALLEGDDGRWVELTQLPTPEELVVLAYDGARGAPQRPSRRSACTCSKRSASWPRRSTARGPGHGPRSSSARRG